VRRDRTPAASEKAESVRSGSAADGLVLERLAQRGFRIEGKGREVVVVPSGADLVVRRVGEEDLRLLRQGGEAGAGFALCTAEPSETREIGRTSRMPGAEGAASGASILLDDGRLFRIVPRFHERGACIELCGWEERAAYWTCRPSRGQLRIEPTVAGRCLPLVDGLVILFAAEILESFET
jgi:hypothetical protein